MDGLTAFRKTFQPALERFLRAKRTEGRRITSDPDVRGYVDHAMRLVSHGGKRIRPYLADVLYRAAGGTDVRRMRDIGVGLELFHAFALIHDDIMDEGMHRHGLRTMHADVASRLTKGHRVGDLRRAGASQAILAGDLLFNWSQEAMSTDARVSSLFQRMVDEVIYGQMIDVDLSTRTSASSRMILEKMRLKTAGYTFVRPMQIGAALAGARNSLHRFCGRFGMPLGLAFQMQDDLLDLTSPPAKTGKTAFSDLAERQHTLLTQFITERGTRAQKSELARIMGRRSSEKDRARITKLFTESGAFASCERKIRQQLNAAEQVLIAQRFPKEEGRELQDLVQSLRDRMR